MDNQQPAINNHFCNYTISKLAQKAGFDNKCIAIVYEDDETSVGTELFVDIMLRKDPSCIKCPLKSQLVNWFRERHSLDIHLYQNAGKDAYNISFEYTDFRNEPTPFIKQGYGYNEALEWAFLAAFDHIQKKQTA